MSNLNHADIVKQQYATETNLNTRIAIHEKYSTNKVGFGNWIFSNYEISKGMTILELGCGTGDMWKGKKEVIDFCSKLVLSDFSARMVRVSQETVGFYDNVEYQVIDIQNIPFEDKTFDIVIANMMLYHVPDLHKALAEVRRVLKKGGKFYCATYGEHGIMEYLSKLFSGYGMEESTNKNFTLQNGGKILSKFFSKGEKLEYMDSLAVTNVNDMVEYIYSLSSMALLWNVPKQDIKNILMRQTSNGVLHVPKEYGMFRAA